MLNQLIAHPRTAISMIRMLAGTGMSAAANTIREPEDLEGVIITAQANLENNLRRMAAEDKNLFVKKMARKINEASGPFQPEVAE